MGSIKKKVKVKEADKKYKPKDEYYKKQGEKTISKADEEKSTKTESQKMPSYIRSKEVPIPTKQKKGRHYKVVYPNGQIKRYYEDAEGIMWEKLAAGRARVSEEAAQHIREGVKAAVNPNNPASTQQVAGQSKYNRVKPPPNTIAGKTNPDAVGAEYRPGDWYNVEGQKWENKDPEERLNAVEDKEYGKLAERQMMETQAAAELARKKEMYNKAAEAAKLSGRDIMTVYAEMMADAAKPKPKPEIPAQVEPTNQVGKSDFRGDAGSVVDGAIDIAQGAVALGRKGKKKLQEKDVGGKLKGLIARSKEKGNEDFVSGPIEESGVYKAWEDYQMDKGVTEDMDKMLYEMVERLRSKGLSYEDTKKHLTENLQLTAASPMTQYYFYSRLADVWRHGAPKPNPAPKQVNPANAVLRTHKEAKKENPEMGHVRNLQTKTPATSEEMADYDAKVKQIVRKTEEIEEDPLPEDYPNSFYQKLWERLEDASQKTAAPKKMRGKNVPKDLHGEERLSHVLSRTPETPQYNREEVVRIANSMRAALGKEPWRKRTDKQLANEDEKMSTQMNSLWEQTETKPMTETKVVKKEMKHLYGAPVEDLPETESPPPILYKTIEPVKKKEKT